VITAETWLSLAAANAEACRRQCEAEDREHDSTGRVLADTNPPEDTE
jgi:hypothetical protein